MKRRFSVLIALCLAFAMLFSSCDAPNSSDTNNDSGVSDNGSTDDGSTDNGSTDNGSTDNGSTDNGSTDNGSTDNGSTDNDSTDNGSTDNGSTDNGSTDNGSTDNGSTDNGSTDNGSTDNGTTDDDTTEEEPKEERPALTKPKLDLSTVPEYDGSCQYVVINGNDPYFTPNQYTGEAYEYYSELDALGRCGIAVAILGSELMPEGDRENLGSVSPSGWHGNAIYERCHLIAFALAGESANEKNLITGTCGLNDIMKEFESLALDYIKETGNHVLYRVEPIFEGDNLVASGVQMEAYSIEDEGEGVCFNIYVYNVQVDCVIDYATGDFIFDSSSYKYVLSKNTKKIHKPDCRHVHNILVENREETNKSIEELIEEGYTTCGTCKPQNE